MTQRKTKNQLKNRQYRSGHKIDTELSFAAHLSELRRRLIYIAVTVTIGATFAYFIQQSIVAALLRPAHGVQFIYTSPGGGITFLFSVIVYAGIAVGIPVIIYQTLKFTEPLMKNSSHKFILRLSMISGLLAILGIMFGYFIGLPIALSFLSHQFTSKQIHPLFTIQEYMSFITFYLVGSALIFQMPIIITLSNRIKPLKPKKLFHYEKFVIAGAFIISAFMSPSIKILPQLVIAVPLILSYQIAILVIWLENRSRKPKYNAVVKALIEMDKEAQARRTAISREAYIIGSLPQQDLDKPNDLPAKQIATHTNEGTVVDSLLSEQNLSSYARVVDGILHPPRKATTNR